MSAGSLLGIEEFAERYWGWASKQLKKIPDDRRRNIKSVALLVAVLYSGFLAWNDEHQALIKEQANNVATIKERDDAAKERDDAVSSLRNYKLENTSSEVTIDAWGGDQPVYGMMVNTKNLSKYKNYFKLILIVKAEFADIDQLTDTVIEKSIPYTITGEEMNVVHRAEGILRFNANARNQIRLYLVLLPNTVSPADIKTLSDIDRVGARILARRGQVVYGGPPAKPG